MDVAGEEQGTARSGGEEEGEVHKPQREDQAANLAGGDESDDPYNNDPGRWGNNMDVKVCAYWDKMGLESCQNKDADLSASERQYKQQRIFFSKMHFKCKLSNRECVPNGRT